MAHSRFVPLLFFLIGIGTFTLTVAEIPSSSRHNGNDGDDDNNPYRHRETLDPEGKYLLEWLVDWERERIFFNVTVQTRGWVGFGFSKNGTMPGADLIMGGVDWMGRWYFSDRYALGGQVPIPLVDIKQDWELHSAWETGSHTRLSFSRLFDTCDKEDIPITDDTMKVLWAYGKTDDTNEYHLGNRGSVPMYLRDPDLTPRFIKDAVNEGRDISDKLSGSDVKVWSLRSTFKIPPKRTTYWCNIHKLTLARKHHIIGFSFKINNEAQPNMHHLLLFRCVLPNPSSVFEKFVNHPGEECYDQSNHFGEIPFQTCAMTKGGHTIGGHPAFLPESMGIPIGSTGQSEYYLLQMHYDNPENRTDLVVESQFDVYYTSKLRPNDGGVMSIGHHIPGSPQLLLPPGSPDQRIYGHCGQFCTRKMFPPQGIKVVGALLHAHLTGRRIIFQHFRNNQELAPILQDQNWNPNFQPLRLLRNEVSVLPGDQLTVRCHYDTSNLTRTTVGGSGTDQEMCKTFAYYYNLLEDYPICRSLISSDEYLARFLGGTRNITWDQSRLDFMATAPPHLAGMTMAQISDSRYINWSIVQRTLLQREHILYPQVDICPTADDVIVGELTAATYSSYPVEASPFQPAQRCSLVS